MPRPKQCLVYKYFTINQTQNNSKCNVCNAVVKGPPHAGNLQAHLHRHHPEIETEMNEEELSSKQTKMTEFVSVQKEEYVMVKFSKRDLQSSALALVTHDGRPFSSVEDKGYKMIVDRIIAEWNQQYPKNKVAINRHNVPNLIKNEALNIINLIKKEVSGNMVSVKMDCAARFDRSFIGINIQYRNESDVLRVYTVGTIETFSDHTGEYLLEELKNTLSKFGIEEDQIYSVTIDNGANMVKMCALLNHRLASKFHTHSNLENETEATIATQRPVLNDEEEEEFYLDGVEEYEVTAFTEYQEKIMKNMEQELKINAVVPVMRCAAHTLQLAIYDTLKNEKRPLNRVIAKVKAVVVKLRTPKNRKKLRSVNAKIPVLANATRWSSSGLMLHRFSKLRPKIEELGEKGLLDLEKINYTAITNNDWLRIKFALKALQKCQIATTCLQKENLTLNEFFTVWTSCQFEVSKLKSKFAKRLEKNMEKRQQKLLHENEPLIASLLLDPRYKSFLSPALTSKAMDHITILYGRIVAVAEKSSPNPTSETLENPSSSSSVSTFSEYLRKSILGPQDEKNNKKSFQQELNEFIGSSFNIDMTLNRFDLIKEFWVKEKYKFPLLYKVARVLLSTPATQTSVERLFSHLHFILNELRFNISSENIDDILLVRWNGTV